MWPFRKKMTSETNLNFLYYFHVDQLEPNIRLQLINKELLLSNNLSNLDYIQNCVKDNLIENGDTLLWDIKIQWDNDDQREPYKINEIRTWHKTAHAKYPYLPIFLAKQTLGPYLSCLIDIKKIKTRRLNAVVVFYSESLIKILGEALVKGMAFYDYCNGISTLCGNNDRIVDNVIVSQLNAFVERSLSSIKINNSELNKYRELIKKEMKKQ